MANILGKHRVHWKYDGKETVCTIENQEQELVARGSAVMFHKDTYDKKVARATTFKRAMAVASSLDKDQRGELWTDFRDKINQPS